MVVGIEEVEIEQISSYRSRHDVLKSGAILSNGFRMGPCRLFLKELEPEHFDTMFDETTF